MGFYKAIEKLNPNHQNVAMTVLDGDCLGQKALISDGILIWESEKDGFFSRCKEQIVERLTCKLNSENDGEDTSRIEEIGGAKLYCELLGQEKKLVICGAGHVSIPIIRMGQMIGFHVTVLEDRPKFADDARRAGADQVICESFEDGLNAISGDGDTFFVIVTRGHAYDQICLESIIKKPHAYIGMMGSRKRVGTVKEAVIAGGGSPGVVNNIHSPIGLNIGAETPEEIAVSIMSELIAVKNKKKRSLGYSGEIKKAIQEDVDMKKVLATIVKKKGSAPRSVGTKMVVFPDGRCAGTIGGGCVEARIIQKALLILRDCENAPCVVDVDMTGREAEEEGMVCGGIVEVLLEVIEEI